jgi:hypothetical protein
MYESNKERENQQSYMIDELQMKAASLTTQNNELKLKEVSQV